MRAPLRFAALLLALPLLAACAPRGLGPDAFGRLARLEPPPWPGVIPPFGGLDEATGLHVTGKPAMLDPATWRLSVEGAVEKPLSLDLDSLRRMPRVASRPLLVCRGYFEDSATWAGVSLAALLDLAGVSPEARSVILVGADGYETFVSLDEALAPGTFLAYELEGGVLPRLHGFPLRAVFPSLPGAKWAKWLLALRVE